VLPDDLWRKYPHVFHMAAVGSWPAIQRHGLLSTIALLRLFGITGGEFDALTTQRRRETARIRHAEYGEAVIRDQKPISDRKLAACLRGITVSEWHRLLNGHVFFWTDRKRLADLRHAAAYRAQRQTVITCNTRSLVERHHDRVRLTPINTGSTYFNAVPRGRDTFMPIAKFNRRKIVELTVDNAVPDIRDHAVRVEEIGGGEPDVVLWARDSQP